MQVAGSHAFLLHTDSAPCVQISQAGRPHGHELDTRLLPAAGCRRSSLGDAGTSRFAGPLPRELSFRWPRTLRGEVRRASDEMGGGGGGGKSEKARRPSSARVKLWVARASTVLLWTCVVHLAAYRELWAPIVLTRWPGCLNQPHVVQNPSEQVAAVAVADDAGERQAARAVVLPPKSELVASWFVVFGIFANHASLLSLVRDF